MKTFTLALLLTCLASFSTQAHAQLSSFAGQWKNADFETHSLTKIQITVSGTEISIEAFGSCSPTDCPLGTTNAFAYASHVIDDIVEKASALTATYDVDFAEVRFVIHRKGRNRIQVETFTHFKDGSGRTDIHAIDTMRRLRKGEVF